MKIQDLTDTSSNRVIKVESSTNFVQSIPDSHFWTDINQILVWIKYATDEEFNKRDYLRIGLENTLKQGYNLKK